VNQNLLVVLANLACAAASAQTANPLTQAVTARYESVRQNLIETAAAMPESDYNFRLTPPQRPFGEWLGHTAMVNYSLCASIRGTQSPDTSQLHGLTAKAALKKALSDSFDYCDASLKAMDDKKALTEVKAGDRATYPVQAMVSLVAALNEHYGNLVGYMRSKGIVPPSSARTPTKK
jgi:hypothetical protein